MQDSPLDAHQLIAQPSQQIVVQPVDRSTDAIVWVTLLGVLLAFAASVWSMRQQRRMLLYELQEARAKDRHRALQDEYARFATAAYDILDAYLYIAQSLEHHFTSPDGVPAHFTKSEEEIVNGFVAGTESATARLQEAKVRLSNSRARLHLLDHKRDRVAEMDKWRVILLKLGPFDSPEIEPNHRVPFNEFIARVGGELEGEYHHSLKRCHQPTSRLLRRWWSPQERLPCEQT